MSKQIKAFESIKAPAGMNANISRANIQHNSLPGVRMKCRKEQRLLKQFSFGLRRHLRDDIDGGPRLFHYCDK